MIKNILILSIFLFFSCNSNRKDINVTVEQNEKKEFFSKLRWLSGSWLFSEGKNSFHENWSIKNDSVMVGQGFVLSGSDTVEIENLSIHTNNENLIYSVSISKDKTINYTDFTFNQEDFSCYSFENAQHDFPKRIMYKNISDTKMEVTIDAGADSSQINQKFFFIRVSN